jgi:hypothetical protein
MVCAEGGSEAYMFNLLVSGNGEWWETPPLSFEIDRFKEYSGIETTGEVWPQGFFKVKHEPTGDWRGRVQGLQGQTIRVIAVVAPPTSHDFFMYSEKVGRETGGHFVPLDHIPAECRNSASVQTYFPRRDNINCT